jgi:Tryptophan-associated transmembrane protein (Trp_oprn_chp)
MNSPRRELTIAVVACALGSVVALLTAARTWRIVAVRGAVPLPNEEFTGTELLPWLPAVALVGLAGAGALLAVRGRARTVLGLLLVLTALAIVCAGGYGATIATGGRRILPVLLGLGGLLVGYAGLRAFRRGASWPALGSRYERPSPTEPVEYVERSGPSRSDVAMWDALDRGEDPTTGS